MNENKPIFIISKKESTAALFMYASAFLYTYIMTGPIFTSRYRSFLIVIFTLSFIGIAEYLFHEIRRPAESQIWLCCIIIITLSIALDRMTVWGFDLSFLFLHIFAVYWVLSRSNRLCGSGSSSLLPLDILNGYILFPFKHFFLRIRCLFLTFSQRKKTSGKKSTMPILLASLVAASLFFAAVGELASADSAFGDLIDSLDSLMVFPRLFEVMFRFILSLPVGAFLFGLIAGTLREPPVKIRERGLRLTGLVAGLRQVPQLFWLVVLCAFSIIYFLFFFIQGQYLFSAFFSVLPEDFTVAEYARRGFFELCRIMTINFALFWCVTRTGKTSASPAQNTATKTAAVILMGESLIFSAIAFSKLALYISRFGFTFKRLASTWLVCLLFVGCLCILLNYLKGKKTFKVWMIYGALSLSLLCLI